MAFSGLIMPKIKLVHGVSKSVIDPVMVVGNGNRETRRKQNRYERFAWKFPSRSILQASKQELYTFFRTTNAALDSFMFQDPDYPEFINTIISEKVDGGTNPDYLDCWYFQTPDGHPIFNFDYNSTFFTSDNDEYSFSPDGAIEYHNITGRPIIRISSSYTFTTYLKVNGPCYLTARLNGSLGWSISAMDKSPNGTDCTPTPLIVDMADLDIIEVFEHA